MPSQVISSETVRSAFEERLQETLVFRDAFRGLDATGVTGDTIKVPNPADVMAEPAAIEPTADYPTTREEYEKISIERQKYGEIVKVPEEDAMDSIPDLVADHVDLAAREMAEFLDGLAYGELSSNLSSDGPVGGDDGDLTYDDIQEGVTTIEENKGQPDMAFFGPQAKGDILKYLADRGTDLGDEAVTTGQFGGFAGLDFLYSTAGELTAHDVILVDSDRYGYEATFEDINTEEERDFDSDTQKYKIRTMKGFKAMKPEIAVMVQG